MNVLLVDDDAEIRMIAGYLLRAEGLDVREAADAAAAEAALAERPADLVLMDVMLGEDDGIELAKRLGLGSDTTTSLIFLTGATRPDQLARMHDAGAAGILQKPFDPVDFVDRLYTMIDSPES